MNEFEKQVRSKVADALAAMGADVQFVTELPSVDTADLAVPCFTMSKALRKAPQAIADDLAAAIQPSGLISSVSSCNGYLNFCMDGAALVKGVLDDIIASDGCFNAEPTGQRVNVEHTSTNPTGPIHVGRARNPIIGDTLARCLKRCGHDVTTEYYVNDVGKQVVILTWGVNNVSDEVAEAEAEEHARNAGHEKERDKTDHKLVAKYRVANRMMESDPEVQAQIADMLRRFEAGDREVIDTVRHTAEIMLGGLRETLSNINVELDRYTWESDFIADGSARDVVERLKGTDYAGQTEDGAWFVDLKDFGILFYSFVSLPEGKMSTRKGVVVYLDDLIDEAVAHAYDEIKSRVETRNSDMTEERMREIARIVGTGSIRYNIVRVQPEKQLVFKWSEALNFDGNSGPYLQYVHARACSMLRKAGEYQRDTDPSKLTDPMEVNLVKKLSRYEEVLREAGDGKRVHMLPAYGHELAVAFNQFYAAVSVLDAGPRRDARLTLVECTKTVLADVLDCLGMGAPEEM